MVVDHADLLRKSCNGRGESMVELEGSMAFWPSS